MAMNKTNQVPVLIKLVLHWAINKQEKIGSNKYYAEG